MKRTSALFLLIALIFSSCSVTTPELSYSGGNYNSISDDMILKKSTDNAVQQIANSVNRGDKILIVQVVDDPISDMLADKIFERLSVNNVIVGRTTNEDLKEMNTEMFDKFLMFYPEIYGTETAQTKPSSITKAISFIPVIGQIVGPYAIKANTYTDRQAGVNIHCRLADRKTGKIDWIRSFSGQSKIRLQGGLKQELGISQ